MTGSIFTELKLLLGVAPGNYQYLQSPPESNYQGQYKEKQVEKQAGREKGASMVEYALLIVLIAIVAMVALALLGDNIAQLFTNVGSQIPGGGSSGTVAP